MSDSESPDTADDGAGPTRDSSETPQGKNAKKTADEQGKKRGFFSRMALFFRQMVAELRKVIWPTRKELITYTWVVLVFVIVMGAYIGGLDFLFARGVLAVFG